MQRYFIEDTCLIEDIVTLPSEESKHITKVMRMRNEDTIVCCFTEGRSALCSLIDVSSNELQAKVVEWLEENNELPIQVTIASGLPKGDKLEYIAQKATELGMNQLLPFKASRSIVKWDEKKGSKKVERLEKIAKEAAEQSYRNIIPEISTPISFKELIVKSSEYDRCIVAYEETAKENNHGALKEVLSEMEYGDSLLVVFGPEGGLSEDEVSNLVEVGFVCCSLGSRILRTETAPMYLLSAVSYHFEI